LNLAAVAILTALCDAIDRRPYMDGHGARVGELAELVALRLGWAGSQLRRLRLGARLHDLGKLAVSDDVWRKRGRLTDAEVDAIRRHPLAGVRMLARQPSLRFAVPFALFHHEHWDGGGYPSGRAGDAIPLEARVLALADAFDAMTTDRPYRRALPVHDALAEIERCAGTQFDPQLARLFVELWASERRVAGATR
jgi:HD-GYP domain-containing protein (c-di-GMP phosphodiesterase class II)